MLKLWFSRNLKKAIEKIMDLFAAIDEDMDNFERALTDLQENSVSATLSASGWSNKEYSFESTYPSATYKHVTMDFDYDTGTEAQLSAYKAAYICPSKTTNKVYCKGVQPTVNIPIILKVRRGQ